MIYLDQNVFSVLFRVQTGGRLPKGHERFSVALYEKLRKVVLLQQAVCPHSDIHQSETIVFEHARALRELYEGIGGDIAFENTSQVELSQTLEFASAFTEARDPAISFNVDDVLSGERNEWLPDMRVTVNANYDQFAPGIRETRRQTHQRMSELIAGWAEEKPTFEQVLERELAVVGRAKVVSFARMLQQYQKAMAGDDIDALLNASLSPIQHEQMVLKEFFRARGVAEESALKEVLRFWQWEHNREQPSHLIFANLIAAIARRVSLGQRSFSQGLMNDLRAISVYGPYVDAMFVDKEFANLLRETPQLRQLPIRARIFSFHAPNQFLDYLDELEGGTPPPQRQFAERIYNVA